MRPRIIDPVLTAGFDKFSKALERYVKEMEGDTGELVRRQGRLFAVDLAAKTNPFGFSKGAQESGKRSIMGDVSRVFVSPGRVYKEIEKDSVNAARQFYALAKEGEIQKAEKILDRVGGKFRGLDFSLSSSKAHQGKRNSRGRVTASRPDSVVQDPKQAAEYSEHVQFRVAWAKASWVAEAWKLGGVRGVPAWVKVHTNSPGFIQDGTRGDGPIKNIVFESRVSYVWTLLSETNVARALAYRGTSMIKELERIAISKANQTL